MDQIWLVSPSPALRLWPGSSGATWRLNPAAAAWARQQQFNESSWRDIANALSEAHAGGPDREGRLADPPLRWRSLPMSTGWLVWLMPEIATAPTLAPAPATVDCALRTSSAQWLDLLRGFDTFGLFEYDLGSDAFRCDSRLFDLFGFDAAAGTPTPEQVVSRIHPDDRDRVSSAHRRFMAAPGRHSINYRIRRDDGPERAVQSWIDVRADAAGRTAYMVGAIVDRTEYVSVAQPGAAEHIEPVERPGGAARSEFLARMSHELRTPLNAVLGFAQLIEHDGTSVPAGVQLERVVHIREAGEQLLQLIGAVLEHLKRDALADVPEAAPAAAESSAVAPEATHRPLSVLYIEDNPVNVLLVEELVAMRPETSLRCAVTGLAGVALAAAGAPDVVLVDMQLPDIDGFEVLRRLRADRSLDGSAVIALSANGMGDDIALALAAGFDDYWTKPIHFGHFLSGLDTLAQAR